MIEEDHYVGEDDTFSNKHGFAFAFTIIDEDLEMEPLDPRIGQLRVKAIEWGNGDDGEYFYRKIFLDTHICSEAELGLSDDP